MRVTPVILDIRSPYLGHRASDSTVLQTPVGDRALIAEIAERAALVTPQPPVVLPTVPVDANYRRRIMDACPSVSQIMSIESYRDPLSIHDASDALLIISPLLYPADGADFVPLMSAKANDARMARHLLAFEASTLGTKELVHAAGDGRLRRIQRYFDPVTWPFPAGMLASFVPLAALLTQSGLPIESLDDLRTTLASRGVPHQDVPFHGEFFDLRDESATLALIERRLLSSVKARGVRRTSDGARDPMRSEAASIHPSARLIGPVHVGAGATIEENAVIIGPTAIGANATIGARAMVAQCFVTESATVAEASTVRHRIIAIHSRSEDDDGLYRRHTMSSTAPEVYQAGGPSARLDYAALKPILESFVAAIALLMLSPIMLTLMALVKFTSAGPIFYGDKREGIGGKMFRCWKFRSMLTNADAMQKALAAQQQMDGPQFKMDRDPRITKVGHWLRKLNVDELPQLFNVLMGQMSFVGPRPSPFRENQICIPWRKGRLSVRPGITGLWQVCRHDRANGDFHQWIQYDLLYVRHMSFALDCKIFFATIITGGGKRAVNLSSIIGDVEQPRVALSSEAPCADVLMKPRALRSAERPIAELALR